MPGPDGARDLGAAARSAGREPDLAAAMAMCEDIMRLQPAGTTDAGWAALALTADHLAGRPARVRGRRRLSDGTVIEVVRHVPKNPRLHPMRFVRT